MSLFLFAVVVSFTGVAQGIVFETGSWSDVLAKAKETGKPVFVDVFTTWCGPCKMMSKDIFPLEEVGTFYNENFVCYKLDAETDEGRTIAKQYQVKGYPTYLYVRADGSIIYRFMGSCQAEFFLRITKTALAEFKDPKTLQDWDAEYLTHQNDTAFLKGYIQKRNKQSLSAVDLLEVYIKLLPEAERANPELVDLYLSQYDNMRVGTFVFDHLVQHPAIFSGRYTDYLGNYLGSAILSTVRDAARKKDLALLEKAVAASKQTADFGTNLTSDALYMNYYRATGETSKYTKYLFAKCDQEVQQIFKDSLQENQKAAVANDLNENAWQLYLTSSNKDTLQYALRWSKRSVELSPKSYTFLDTQACILYRLGKKKEAVAMEKKAVALIKKPSLDYERYSMVVQRMKAGEKIWEK